MVLPSKGQSKASIESSDLKCGPFDSKKWLGFVTVCYSSFHQVPHPAHMAFLGTQPVADPALHLCPCNVPSIILSCEQRGTCKEGRRKVPWDHCPTGGDWQEDGRHWARWAKQGNSHSMLGSAAGKPWFL